jgi:hypothetical protein
VGFLGLSPPETGLPPSEPLYWVSASK